MKKMPPLYANWFHELLSNKSINIGQLLLDELDYYMLFLNIIFTLMLLVNEFTFKDGGY